MTSSVYRDSIVAELVVQRQYKDCDRTADTASSGGDDNQVLFVLSAFFSCLIKFTPKIVISKVLTLGYRNLFNSYESERGR